MGYCFGDVAVCGVFCVAVVGAVAAVGGRSRWAPGTNVGARSIRGMTEIPRFAWFATLFGGASSVRHSGEFSLVQFCTKLA